MLFLGSGLGTVVWRPRMGSKGLKRIQRYVLYGVDIERLMANEN